MQTFLPYKNFKKSAQCLDYRRLNKQILEAKQIYDVLTGRAKKRIKKDGSTYTAWENHPATNMWRGYEDALALYHNTFLGEWVARGYNNNRDYLEHCESPELPWWIGNSRLHQSHRSNLLRKDRKFYSRYWPWDGDDASYYWPGGKHADFGRGDGKRE